MKTTMAFSNLCYCHYKAKISIKSHLPKTQARVCDDQANYPK